MPSEKNRSANSSAIAKPGKFFQLNRFQLRQITGGKKQINIGGRGSGKSFGLSFGTQQVAHSMPRATFLIVGRSYTSMLWRTLPPVIAGWEALGYYENIHYVIGKEPPKHWPRAYQAPLDYKRYISWYTGAGFHLGSQENKGSMRGLSVDGIFADEGLLLNKGQFESETLPTNRGNNFRFKHDPLHHLIWIVSSMPESAEAMWLLKYREHLEQQDKQLKKKKKRMVEKMMQFLETRNQTTRRRLWDEYIALDAQLRWGADKDGWFYQEGNVFDNIHNVGLQNVLDAIRPMHPYKVITEYLNGDPERIEDGFYPNLNTEHHGYYANDEEALLGNINDELRQPTRRDCRLDMDLNKDQPLIVAFDWGASFNCCTVAQWHGNHLRFINDFWRKHPHKVVDVVKDFVEYYKHHRKKVVRFHFDQTAIGQDGKNDFTYRDLVKAEFVAAGWSVDERYMGKAPNHFKKYEKWAKLMVNHDPSLPEVRFNLDNAKHLVSAMEMTGIKKSRSKVQDFEKDKTPEQDPNVPQEEAPHLTDAADQLMWGEISSDMRKTDRNYLVGEFYSA